MGRRIVFNPTPFFFAIHSIHSIGNARLISIMDERSYKDVITDKSAAYDVAMSLGKLYPERASSQMRWGGHVQELPNADSGRKRMYY